MAHSFPRAAPCAPFHLRASRALHDGHRARRRCAAAAPTTTRRNSLRTKIRSNGRTWWRYPECAGPPRSSTACRRYSHHQTDAGASRPHARLHGHRRVDSPVQRQAGAAGRHRLYRLSVGWRRPDHPPRDFLFQRRAGRSLGLSATRQCRTLAAGHQHGCADFLRYARPPSQRGDLARLYRSRLHRSGRHRL